MIEYSLADDVATLRLAVPPLNVLSLELLEALTAAVRRANDDPAVRGIVVAGNAEHFSAGADVQLFRAIATDDDAVRISRLFQEAMDAVERSEKPVVAALAGQVVGGALELAMACHRRVSTTRTRFQMPEIHLGINPGAGATQRLPRLVGPDAALAWLLSGQTVDAVAALAAGLIDETCDAEQLMQRSTASARCGEPVRPARDRTEKIADAATVHAALAAATRNADAGRPELIAARRIVDLVRAGIEESFESGLRRERTAFAECMATPAVRNKIYLFFAKRDTHKLPEFVGATPCETARVAVVGFGTMGTGIVQAFQRAGTAVLAVDEDEAALARGTARIDESIRKRVQRGELSPAKADAMRRLVQTTTHWDALAEADLVVESVVEDLAVKQAVVRRLEEACSPRAILATNTSTLSLDAVAGSMHDGSRLVGMHFFNPAQRMPLVEVIRRAETPRQFVATVVDVVRRLRKTPVVVNNREGFLVNRVFVPYAQEAFALWEEGAEPAEIDAAAVDFGLPMGPLALIDMAGIDILVHAQRVLAAAFPHHRPMPVSAIRLVEQGRLGQKTGRGVYRYEPGSFRPLEDPAALQCVRQVRSDSGRKPAVFDRPQITERLVLRMVAEAFRLLEEGVARSSSDVDVATVLGIGFPDFRGGLLRYAEERGLSMVRARLCELTARCGPRFAPCRLLTETKGNV